MRERPTFIDRDDDDDDDAVPPVTSVEQAVEIIRTDRVALRRAEERASKAEYAAAAATARANEANGAVERLKRGEDESPTPPNPAAPPFVPPVKPIGDNKKMMSRLFHRLEHSGSPTPSEKDEALAEELERKKRLGEWTPAEDDWRCESEELNSDDVRGAASTMRGARADDARGARGGARRRDASGTGDATSVESRAQVGRGGADRGAFARLRSSHQGGGGRVLRRAEGYGGFDGFDWNGRWIRFERGSRTRCARSRRV